MPDFPGAQSYLIDLNLDKVALCQEGANSRAQIILTKRKETNDMPKTYEELLGILKTDEADVIKTHVAELLKTKDTAITTLNGTIATQQATITANEDTIKSLKETTAVGKSTDTEELLKKADPALASVFKAMKDANALLIADQAEALAKTRFEAVKAIPCEEAALKDVLKTASPAVYEVLCKAAKAVEDSILKGKGSGADGNMTVGADQAYGKLEKSAREIMVAKTGITFEQAFTDACIADPKTYANYVKGE